MNKNRRKLLRWILVEDVIPFVCASSGRKGEFDKVSDRKGFATAKIIFARKLLKLVYYILKERRPYYKDEDKDKVQLAAAVAL